VLGSIPRGPTHKAEKPGFRIGLFCFYSAAFRFMGVIENILKEHRFKDGALFISQLTTTIVTTIHCAKTT
jgi:hypothetical protein